MDKDFLKELFASMGGGDLSKSLNYQFSCVAMRLLCYEKDIDMANAVTNKEKMRELCFLALMFCRRNRGVALKPEYAKLPIHLVKGEGIKGAVIELPDSQYECECNRVAIMVSDDGKRQYYTSEYYAITKDYGLCTFYEDGSRASYASKPSTLEEFLECLKVEIVEE
ncbi:MAG: hypothetical protein J6B34_06395 [Clostridia bacterium]|nr:hypothetical protein [Clostridia bacterium]